MDNENRYYYYLIYSKYKAGAFMEKTNDAEISLLDAPVGAVVDLVSWGNLSQEDIRKLTDVGIYLDLPLTVSSVTISGPVVVAISNVPLTEANGSKPPLRASSNSR